MQVTVRNEGWEPFHHHSNQVRCQLLPIDLHEAVEACKRGKSKVSVVLPQEGCLELDGLILGKKRVGVKVVRGGGKWQKEKRERHQGRDEWRKKQE